MTGGGGASENTGGAAASIEHTGREKRAIYWIRRRVNGEKLNSQGAGLGQPLMDALRTLMRALRCVGNASHTSMQECLCAVMDCAPVQSTPKQQERSESTAGRERRREKAKVKVWRIELVRRSCLPLRMC